MEWIVDKLKEIVNEAESLKTYTSCAKPFLLRGIVMSLRKLADKIETEFGL